MSNDRELLELAAKAAGIAGTFDMDCIRVAAPSNSEGWYTCWSPLTDDGEALRLAVKLELQINIENVAGIAHMERYGGKYHAQVWYVADGVGRCIDLYDDDGLAATRRAIVIAAAEIGKAKP